MTNTNNNNDNDDDNDVIVMNKSRPNWNIINMITNNNSNNNNNSASTTSSNSIDTSTTTTTTTIIRERCEWDDKCYQESLRLYYQFMNDDHGSDAAAAAGGTSFRHTSIKEALACLSTAYHKYGGPNSVVCSFNGGKDAVVLLHLVRAAHAYYYHEHNSKSRHTAAEAIPVLRPRVIYFDNDDEFIEIASMLQTQVQQYDLDMLCFEKGIGYAQGLTLLLNDHQKQQQQSNTTNATASSSSSTTANNDSASNDDDNHASMMAFMLGTRKGDPNAGDQNMFALSSWGDMPSFMRVNPIIHWNYGMVWQFLRHYQLPYCPLYDQGYTSLGTTQETLRCPALRIPRQRENNDYNDDTDNEKYDYYPAYMLQEWDQERAGRIKKDKKKETKKNEKASSSVSIKNNNDDHNSNNNTQSKNNPHDASSSSSSVSGETTASTATMSSVGTSDAATAAVSSSSSSSLPAPPSLIY